MKEKNWRQEIQATILRDFSVRIREARGDVRLRGVYFFMGEIIAFLYRWEIFRKENKFM